MEHTIIMIRETKKIALVAHDNKKQDLVEWAKWNRTLLANHELYATGTTGRLIEEAIGTPIHKLQSGPLGGDQQIGAMIAEGALDFMIFFWDPLEPQPHDTDVKALLRIAVVWNIPVACNRASADFMISSTCMVGEYERLVPDYDKYRGRASEGVVAAELAAAEAETDTALSLDAAAETELDATPSLSAGAGTAPPESAPHVDSDAAAAPQAVSPKQKPGTGSP